MATWADQIPNFSPYVQQLPVDAYTRVGIMKQGEYEQGLQRAQGYIDSIAGLDIAKPSTRDYLNNKLADMKQALGKNMSGDFSDSKLINQIGGAVGQIASDPIILNGVTSTAYYRKMINDIQTAQKDNKGAYGESNAWYAMKEANQWLNDGDNTTSFSGSYTPKYDVDKDIQEAVKNAHLDATEWQDIPLNPDGTPNTDVLVQRAKKGLLRGKVGNIVGQVFAKPEVQRQLSIDGLYTYQNYTPQMLKDEQDKTMSYYEQKNKELRSKLGIINTFSKKEQGEITQSIMDADKDLTDKTNEYNRVINLINTNPEQAKIDIHMSNQRERYIANNSWEDNSEKLVENPQAKMNLERMNYDLRTQEFQYRKWEDDRNYQLKLSDEQRKMMIMEGKLNPDGTRPQGVTYDLSPQNLDELNKKVGIKAFADRSEALNNQITQQQAKIFSSMQSPKDAPVKYNDMFVQDDAGMWQINYKKYGSWDNILPYYRAAINELDRLHQKGDLDPDHAADVQRLYDLKSLAMARQHAIDNIMSDPKYAPWIIRTNDPNNLQGYKMVGAPESIRNEVTERVNDLQMQHKYYTGQFNPKNTEDRQRINQIYDQIIADYTKNKGIGSLGKWTNATKEANLNVNQYQFTRDDNGQYFLQITRNTGGRFDTSPKIPVSEESIAQIKGNVNDPKIDAFNTIFGPFLALNRGKSTTPDLGSAEAENQAIARRPIGKYSVGFQLQELNGSYVPYLYIRDGETGEVLGQGKKLLSSRYANDPTKSPEFRSYSNNLTSTIPMANIMEAIESLTEKDIDLILGKRVI